MDGADSNRHPGTQLIRQFRARAPKRASDFVLGQALGQIEGQRVRQFARGHVAALGSDRALPAYDLEGADPTFAERDLEFGVGKVFGHGAALDHREVVRLVVTDDDAIRHAVEIRLQSADAERGVVAVDDRPVALVAGKGLPPPLADAVAFQHRQQGLAQRVAVLVMIGDAEMRPDRGAILQERVRQAARARTTGDLRKQHVLARSLALDDPLREAQIERDLRHRDVSD